MVIINLSRTSVRFEVEAVVSTCQSASDGPAPCRLCHISIVQQELGFVGLGHNQLPYNDRGRERGGREGGRREGVGGGVRVQ